MNIIFPELLTLGILQKEKHGKNVEMVWEKRPDYT